MHWACYCCPRRAWLRWAWIQGGLCWGVLPLGTLHQWQHCSQIVQAAKIIHHSSLFAPFISISVTSSTPTKQISIYHYLYIHEYTYLTWNLYTFYFHEPFLSYVCLFIGWDVKTVVREKFHSRNIKLLPNVFQHNFINVDIPFKPQFFLV